jgi:hypothetical protein
MTEKSQKIKDSFERYKKMKPLFRQKRRGRPNYCMPFQDARKIVRKEALSSVSDYISWWKINRPSRIPKRPDRTYHKEFISWGDFLGVNNEFVFKRQTYLPYDQAKNLLKKLNIKSIEDWRNICRENKIPKGIPRRPDNVYGKRGEWVSWRDFLGYSIDSKIDFAKTNKSLLTMVKYPDRPNNIITILTLNEINFRQLKEDVLMTGGKIIKTYIVNMNGIWKDELRKYCSPYNTGFTNEYIVHDAIGLFEFFRDNCSEYESVL